jgi:hypothetical protein
MASVRRQMILDLKKVNCRRVNHAIVVLHEVKPIETPGRAALTNEIAYRVCYIIIFLAISSRFNMPKRVASTISKQNQAANKYRTC